MEERIKYVLALDEDRVAMVLIEINRFGGTLIDNTFNNMDDKIKVTCSIKPSVEKEFVEWLEQNKIAYQLL